VLEGVVRPRCGLDGQGWLAVTSRQPLVSMMRAGAGSGVSTEVPNATHRVGRGHGDLGGVVFALLEHEQCAAVLASPVSRADWDDVGPVRRAPLNIDVAARWPSGR
jgi:hypothetical protein